ncbi:phage tail protein [Escherichia coli]|nr:phage tail protein [Escherichia coli]
MKPLRRLSRKCLPRPTEAIAQAENVVLRLSGMSEFVVNNAPEQADDAGPAEPVSAGKCSTVS